MPKSDKSKTTQQKQNEIKQRQQKNPPKSAIIRGKYLLSQIPQRTSETFTLFILKILKNKGDKNYLYFAVGEIWEQRKLGNLPRTKNMSQCSWELSHSSRIKITCSKLPFQGQDESMWPLFDSDNRMFFLTQGLGCEQSLGGRIKGWAVFVFASSRPLSTSGFWDVEDTGTFSLKSPKGPGNGETIAGYVGKAFLRICPNWLRTFSQGPKC